jgi:hypothetical protein
MALEKKKHDDPPLGLACIHCMSACSCSSQILFLAGANFISQSISFHSFRREAGALD